MIYSEIMKMINSLNKHDGRRAQTTCVLAEKNWILLI